MNISTLQADARAKLEKASEVINPKLWYVNPENLNEIILSTVLAVREEVVPEDKMLELEFGAQGEIKEAHNTWGDCRTEINRRFDSLLGGDAKRV